MGRKKRGDKIAKPGNLESTINHAKFGKQRLQTDVDYDSKEISPSRNILIKENMTQKILQQAQRQQDDNEIGIDYEDQHLNFEDNENEKEMEMAELSNSNPKSTSKSFNNIEHQEADPNNPDQQVPDFDIDENDNEAFNLFMTGKPEDRGINLQDLIRQKFGEINEAMGPDNAGNFDPDQNLGAIAGEGEDGQPGASQYNLKPELVEVYTKIGLVMSQYRAKAFPKAFRYIPNLKNWEEALFLTNPEKWTAASVMMATKIFASAMPEPMAQRYYNLVLLPRVRDEIMYFKKLNFHIYEALMKAIFKPMAFFRGFLLPLCKSGNCTLKEATIICSVLRQKSIPLNHAGAAMIKIAELPYNGANSLFLRTLIEKKYNMPFQVLDALVFHFLNMKNEERKLPVLWHQCFLSLMQIYAKDIPEDMRRALLGLTSKQNHGEISREIRELLVKTLPRDIEVGDNDDYMSML